MEKSKPVEQVEALFEQAKKRTSYARRYASLARKIASRTRTHIPAHLRQTYCKKCNSLLTQTRIRNKTLVRTCLACKTVRRKPT